MEAGFDSMTDQRDKAITGPDGEGDRSVAPHDPVAISRRELIRGASIAAPAILTLGSGAVQATAMASAVLVKSHTGAQADGKFYCLDERTTGGFAPSPPYKPNMLMLDPTRTPEVNRYPNRDYRLPKADGSCSKNTAQVSEVQMCQGTSVGGRDNKIYCYKQDDRYDKKKDKWQTSKVPRGILVSAAAMASAGIGYANIKDV